MYGMEGHEMATQLATGDRDRLNEVFGSFIDETIGIVARQTRDTVSFAVGSPAREALDLVGADDLAATVIRREGASALGYTMTEGEPELRAAVAADARTRGIAADTEEVLISAGALQAIDLACRVYLRPGDVVVTESPAFANALSAFRNHGARVVEVAVDDEGLDVAEAARVLRRDGLAPRMFFIVPNFQNPTGETMSNRGRSVRPSSISRQGHRAARSAGVGRRGRVDRQLFEDVPAGTARRMGHRGPRGDRSHGRRETDDGFVNRNARAAHRARVRTPRWRSGARREAP